MKFNILNDRKSKRTENWLISQGVKQRNLKDCTYLICNNHVWVLNRDCFSEDFNYWNVMGAGIMVCLDFEKMAPAKRGIDSIKGLIC